MNQVALFGTSADPPTYGHQALLEGLLATYPVVATWASDNPLKAHGAPLAQRAALLAVLVDSIGNPRLQMVQELSSPWAIETLQRARQRWPQAGLVFVVGSDLAGQIPRWKQASALLQGCRLAIAPRAGWPFTCEQRQALEAIGGQVIELALTIPATASSRVRQQHDPSQIPPALQPTLLQHNLYGLQGQAGLEQEDFEQP
nr:MULTISPECIES: nicotinate-nucleotide adenylyltransferase [unclassified Cyanobium]